MTTVTFPAHGWLPPHAHFSWQHSDQGRDFVTNWRGVIQAPGDGECIDIGSDKPFPNGFGPAYPMVKIISGAFAGHDFYIGHCTTLVNVGERFGFGHPLAHANQGRPSKIGIHVPGDGGWVELGGIQPDGTLGPYSSKGHRFDHILRTPLVIKHPDPPLRYGNQGLRVLGMTSDLRDCGWLSRPYWHFNSSVHGAVVEFKKYHHLPMPPPVQNKDRGVVDDRTAVVIKHAAQWCKRNHRKEHK